MEQDQKTQRIHRCFKVLHIIFAILAVIVAIFRIVLFHSDANLSFWFMSIYTVVFAFMLFFATVRCRWVLN